MLWGIDVSHHQGVFDMGRAKREGFDFAILKATDGASFVDSQFASNVRNARLAGLLTAAYHYQRASASADTQVRRIVSAVPRDVPVIIDVESESGSVALTRDIVGRLEREGYRVPLLYLPRWYWQQLGGPSLAGLPPLWSSRYPDSHGGYASQIYERVPASYWDGYGGNTVATLQFSAAATVAGKTPVDVNAYRGTRDAFAALLEGQNEDMFNDDDRRVLTAVNLDLGKVWDHTGETAGDLLVRLARLFPAIDENAISARKGHSAGTLTNAIHSTWEREFFDPAVSELGTRVAALDRKLDAVLAALDAAPPSEPATSSATPST